MVDIGQLAKKAVVLGREQVDRFLKVMKEGVTAFPGSCEPSGDGGDDRDDVGSDDG